MADRRAVADTEEPQPRSGAALLSNDTVRRLALLHAWRVLPTPRQESAAINRSPSRRTSWRLQPPDKHPATDPRELPTGGRREPDRTQSLKSGRAMIGA